LKNIRPNLNKFEDIINTYFTETKGSWFVVVSEQQRSILGEEAPSHSKLTCAKSDGTSSDACRVFNTTLKVPNFMYIHTNKQKVITTFFFFFEASDQENVIEKDGRVKWNQLVLSLAKLEKMNKSEEEEEEVAWDSGSQELE